jgi:hypothetical protein
VRVHHERGLVVEEPRERDLLLLALKMIITANDYPLKLILDYIVIS